MFLGLLFSHSISNQLLLLLVKVTEVVSSCENEQLMMTPSPLPSCVLMSWIPGKWLVDVEGCYWAELPTSLLGLCQCLASEGTIEADLSKRCFAFPTFLMSNSLKSQGCLFWFSRVALAECSLLCCFHFRYVSNYM